MTEETEATNSHVVCKTSQILVFKDVKLQFFVPQLLECRIFFFMFLTVLL